MKQSNRKRLVTLVMVGVLVLGLLLLCGCAVSNPASNNLDDEGYVKIETLSTTTNFESAFSYIMLPFSYVLEWLYKFTQNYGLALILFAIIIKVILFPASAMSKKSMMKMSRLTPQVKALEKKYADDRGKYQAEVNKLYKEEGAGGCMGCLWSFLPLLLLLPLFYIIREPITWLMYHGSVSQAELGQIQNVIIAASKQPGASEALKAFDPTSFYWQMQALPFISELKADLAAVSPSLYSMNTSFLGIELATIPHFLFWNYFALGAWNAVGQFLLPLFSGGLNFLSMFVSQKLNNKVIVDENGEQDKEMAKSNQTTKTMSYIMPLFSVYIGFIAPAGLSVYWTVQAALSIGQDVILTKHYKKVYDAEDAIKKERAAREAAEEAERERIRAEKRAANPDGITANTSKKRLQQKQKAEQAAKEQAYLAKQGLLQEKEDEDPTRPFRRGRNFDPNRYRNDTDNDDKDNEE